METGNYCILRVEKHKTLASVAHAARHNCREYEPENADPGKAQDNRLYGSQSRKEVIGKLNERLSIIPKTIRKDAVRAIEYVITHSPDSKIDSSEYLKKSARWISKKHGAENVLSVSIHMDEKTPHLHALVVPIRQTEKGPTLSAKSFISGKAKLSQMQTDFHQKVGSKFGLNRGIEKSGAKHTTIREYYGYLKNGSENDIENRRGLGTKKGRKALSDEIRANEGLIYADLRTQNNKLQRENYKLSNWESTAKQFEEEVKSLSKDLGKAVQERDLSKTDLNYLVKSVRAVVPNETKITINKMNDSLREKDQKQIQKQAQKPKLKTKNRTTERDEGR